MDTPIVIPIDENKWEVKLGAGILPIVIGREYLNLINQSSGGTFIFPSKKSLTEFNLDLKAIAAINNYLHNSGK